MNKYIIAILFLMGIFCQFPVSAQSDLTAAGLVMSESGEGLIGVTVIVEEITGKGTVTDADGRFKLTGLQSGQTLIFSYIGYEKKDMKVTKTDERMRVILKEEVSTLDELVVVGHSTQRKASVVGAIANVEVKDLKVPATSVSNMLGARVPGIIAVTRSGEPGKDFSEFWIRGISTFGAGSSALVLIDGVEGDLNTLDAEDIESFSILKDASATAVYGVRGANGVVLVTTKRGRAGKLAVNLKVNTGYSYSPRMPKYVDANQYASLANEAALSRGMEPIYNAVDLQLFKSGIDPDLHPNVNWRDVILNDYTMNQQIHLSASGGGQAARYYMSLGVLNKDALFKQDEGINKYGTNVDYKQYNFRANIDMNLTSSTIMSLGLETVLVTQNYPGFGNDSQALWDAQANMTPVTVPIMFSTGQVPAYGTNNDQISPYVLLNHTGYRKYYRNSTKLNLQVEQDLKMITQGLKFTALFNMTGNSDMWSNRTKIPALYYATGRKRDGSLALEKKLDAQDPNFYVTTEVDRKFYFESRANYERSFNEIHRVTGLVHYYMEDFVDSRNRDDLKAIPKRYLGLSGRATYSYKDTYMIEGNIGYTGSEAFENGKKFGVFPAISVGWLPTQYEAFKTAIPFVNYLKFRASYGQVGNDRMNVRFPYLTLMGPTGSGLWNSGSGYTETQVGSSNLRWETATKSNFGIDAKFLKDRFDMTVDIFKDIRSGIYQQRASVPDEMGLVTLPFANVGKMKSWGVDGHLSYTQSISKDAYFVLRANFTQSKNEILEYEESIVRYPYQSSVGYQWGVNRGLIALGLFKDEADVRNSPRQTFGGDVLPGDIKYKDVNGDGVIDNYDVVPLEYSATPQIQYGFATELNWKNWNLSVLFEGVDRVKYFSGGNGFFPFTGRETGNVLLAVADQASRWTSSEISGDPATENPNARFPRLSYGGNANNNRNSTFWLNDGSYVRLKNVQLSYQTKAAFMKKIGVDNATFSLIGENLHVWDKLKEKIVDPAQAKENGAKYPLQRVYTLQMNLKF
ncbi:SusC/RagA family TonB-linked outer membrane protein [Gaoshiqia sp. Z1-71]|uniref:SusC/RagA family TonB-linked outer membrane protein n=1 Tax=Gaoshiqia hydrogeniformans TaxID=3290090 RepID=UPI003BF89C2B